ncbi:hypothetical protein KEJ47_00225 [Candidatus Bathyarchaeota archaeon]|nr:hypothetical protein [Candidatus Bathyarchaeota archaeon]
MGEYNLMTLSETLQQRQGRRDCPYIHECEIQVTKDYFTRVCNSALYINCHNFAKIVGELRTPMSWLQKLAVDQERLNAQDAEDNKI